MGAISALIAFLSIGVLRRLTFWLILISFLLGGLARIPASVLAFAGILSQAGPPWYVVFQALLGLVQVGIRVLMLIDYRRAGAWGRIPAQRHDEEVRIWRNG